MRILTLFFTLISLAVLSQTNSPKIEYPKTVGDIEFDPKTDNKAFVTCNDNFKYSFQYFDFEDFEYEGEKIAIENEFKKFYNPKKAKKESGLVRIRFIVNCQGKTDRFRILSTDENYIPKKIDKSITEQLLQITRKLNGWNPKKYKEKEVDYYQYLIFKIDKGQLTEILP